MEKEKRKPSQSPVCPELNRSGRNPPAVENNLIQSRHQYSVSVHELPSLGQTIIPDHWKSEREYF